VNEVQAAFFAKCAVVIASVLGVTAMLAADDAPPTTQPSRDATVEPPFQWVSTGALISIQPDAQRQVIRRPGTATDFRCNTTGDCLWFLLVYP